MFGFTKKKKSSTSDGSALRNEDQLKRSVGATISTAPADCTIEDTAPLGSSPERKTREDYQYSNPLYDSTHIRILVLEASIHYEGYLWGELKEVELTENAGYEALSYSWALEDGDDSLSEKLLLNSRLTRITKNLFHALDRLRRTLLPRRLWIDAICIDQGNILERNVQVKIMADIYRCASRVIVWLGRDFKAGEDNKELIRSGYDVGYIAELLIQAARCPQSSSDDDKRVEHLAPAFQIILDSRYFGRRWIVQELHFARDIEIYWSRSRCSLGEFRTALQFRGKSVNHRPGINGISDRVLRAQDLFKGAASGASADPEPLAIYLSKYQDMKCRNPLDRLYSLLSLDPSCRLAADYSVSVGRMGQNVAQYLSHSGFHKTLLRNARGAVRLTLRLRDRFVPLEESDNYPSWSTELSKAFTFVDSVDNRTSNQTIHNQLQSSISTTWTYILRVSLYKYGTCSKWKRKRLFHLAPHGYRELVRPSCKTDTDIIVCGYGQYDDIHEDDLKTGDLVCSVDLSSDWCILLRSVSKARGTHRIVGICSLEKYQGQMWRTHGRKPWNPSQAEWIELYIV